MRFSLFDSGLTVYSQECIQPNNQSCSAAPYFASDQFNTTGLVNTAEAASLLANSTANTVLFEEEVESSDEEGLVYGYKFQYDYTLMPQSGNVNVSNADLVAVTNLSWPFMAEQPLEAGFLGLGVGSTDNGSGTVWSYNNTANNTCDSTSLAFGTVQLSYYALVDWSWALGSAYTTPFQNNLTLCATPNASLYS